ncbi:phosphate ABC transporter substrate-binding protein PstS [Alicyclobacillus fastidiosus]|uniref:Phosphate-binding protein n=1 Tax=Alicyclobacillus fastidiosus TaxID=392011 RepID=A0ABY6ZM33_9BACL|nr:phosphate ABC transporter substrate-binding protein PstS [Alicyclobacillus fastidiosus]WAH43988.1 phosphate ABC transporter substrate-binding protein PstS [Alicyclobacillus fastidiosus]GMA60262.1 phosphate-binding protein PstS 1 [Alicyclobacillus fastidiosus]
MSLHSSKMFAGVAALAAIVAVVGCGTNNTSSNATSNSASNGTSAGAGNASTTGPVSLSESGSSLLYPLFNDQWISAYQSANSNVQMTAASTGSGTGISQAIAGTVDIGASDAYLADAQMQQSPGMLNIPVAISAQQIMYNLPGVKGHLKLSGDVIAQIYEGKIKFWDDSAIRALNPGVTLPHQGIIPITRSDSSGDTFLFTQFLTDTNTTWKNSTAYGTSVSWPSLSSEVGAKGNNGVVDALAKNKYSIGYVGISWLSKATQQGLGYAALQNKDGKFVLPTAADIQAAASQGAQNVPKDERISLIYEPGANSYPIINFEYLIVKQTQKNASYATAMKDFLNWAIDPSKGNSSKYLAPVNFLPLPSNVEPLSQAQINSIQAGQ